MKIMTIASIAHTLNAAYCLSLGDTSQVAWELASEAQRNSCIHGVEMHLANPDATPEDSHASWLAHKVAEGWTYGEVKDEAAKTHPCCVPYDQLPAEQKAKDYIFRATVHALKGIPDDVEVVGDDDPRIVALQDQLNALQAKHADVLKQLAGSQGSTVVVDGVPVKYIGPRESWTDRLYGSGLTFVADQIREVPGELARRFLKHADLFKQADMQDALDSLAGAPDNTADLLAEQEAQRIKNEKRDRDLADLHRELDSMDKNSLIEFGNRYGVKIAKSATEAKVNEARAALHQQIDQFGAV